MVQQSLVSCRCRVGSVLIILHICTNNTIYSDGFFAKQNIPLDIT
jgi:hypothetical protein